MSVEPTAPAHPEPSGRSKQRWRLANRIAAAAVGVEGLILLTYTIAIAVVAFTEGVTGPADVTSPAGVVAEVAVFTLFALGLATIAWGRWRGDSWSTAPYILIQVLSLTVGLPVAFGPAPASIFGIVISVAAAGGLIALATAGIIGMRMAETLDLRDQPAEQPAAQVDGSSGADQIPPRPPKRSTPAERS